IEKGQRVAIMANNSDAYVLLLLALARLGAIAVPVNPEFSVTEAVYIFRHAQVAAIACTSACFPTAREASRIAPRSPWLLLLDGQSHAVANFDDLLQPSAASAAGKPAGPDDTWLIPYTSGTTGRPKGVMHSQRNFVLAGEAFVERMHLQPDDRLM